ncbi:vWA domain-containing protein [Actinoplanes sp. NPDC051851]|uniref:vWA domain-containing protein n=1 Tax=Actinoplanes sp. NPDC051851 TaxID=3154753 RepID=UPI00343B8099
MSDPAGGSGKDPHLPNLIFITLVLMILAGGTYALLVIHNSAFLVTTGVIVIAIQMWHPAIQHLAEPLLNRLSDRIGSSTGHALRRAGKGTAAGTAVVIIVSGLIIFELTHSEPCPHTVELRVLTSTEGLQAARELANGYIAATARENDGCATVFAHVYAATTAEVTSPLARSWVDTENEQPSVNVGTRPDVWLPDSMLDVRNVYDTIVKNRTRETDEADAQVTPTTTASENPAAGLPAPLASITSIASSPIVLAGTKAGVTSAGTTSAGNADQTLSSLVSALISRSKATLAAADPGSSAAGRLAVTAYLHDADDQMVDTVVARQRQQLVSRSTPAATDEISLLCDALRHGAVPSAVLTSLRTWRRLMARKPLGGAGCPAAPATAPGLRAEPLATRDAPALDLPFVQFTWTRENHDQQAAADGFRHWLLSSAGRDRLAGAGLDPPIAGCGSLDHNPCIPDDLTATLKRYDQAKAPGRVLLAMDVSGSMTARTAAGPARAVVAAQGVTATLGQLGEHDEFGLWTFPGRDRDFTELAGLAAGSAKQRVTIADALRRIRPSGSTPLYATILAGMRTVADSGDAPIRALVVLTDGDDTTSTLSPQQAAGEIERLAAGSGPRLYLIAIGEARCEDGPGRTGTGLHLLTDAGRGSCLQADTGKVSAIMDHIFGTLWSGR